MHNPIAREDVQSLQQLLEAENYPEAEDLRNLFSQDIWAKHSLAKLKHERDVFIEIDAYPRDATERPKHEGMLPPCAAIGSFIHSNFDRLERVNEELWITPPRRRDGTIYKGGRVGTLKLQMEP